MYTKNKGLKIFILILLLAVIIVGLFVIVRFVFLDDYGDAGKKEQTVTVSEQTAKDDSEMTSQTDETREGAFVFNGGYYYRQLDNDAKRVYADLTEACRNFEKKVDVNVPINLLYTAAFAMISDHPELYWADKYSVVYSGDTAISVEYEVPDDAVAMSRRLHERATQILSSAPVEAGEYETVKFFYDWIINNVDYGYNDYDQDIRSVFLEGTSVCAGYSKAFLYLCNLADIECAYVRGNARESNHAWNLIRLNGEYYWVDVTWGDPVFFETDTSAETNSNLNYNYFCVTDEEIFRNHDINLTLSSYGDVDYDSIFSFPECTDTSLNYYRLKGVYFESYDPDEIVTYIADKLAGQENINIEMMFDTAEQYEEAYSDLFYREDSLIGRAIEQGMPDFYGSYYCEYSSNEDIYYIVISVYFE